MNRFQSSPYSPRGLALGQPIVVPTPVVPAPAVAVVSAPVVPALVKVGFGATLVALGGYGLMKRRPAKTTFGAATSWMPLATLLGGLWIGAEGLGINL